MIDNIGHIRPLLKFEAEHDFYMLYIFKRKKDQPEGQKENHQSVRTIKTYCIHSLEHLRSRYEEIKSICEYFEARAYIHVQRQNHKDVGLNMMVELATRLKDGAVNQRNLFESVVGQLKVYEKRWIVDLDIDKNDTYTLNHHINCINEECDPVGEKVICTIPTPNGFHLITSPFNVMKYQQHMASPADIQKKNPTLLYYPNSLNKL